MITVKLDVDLTHLERIPGALEDLPEIVQRWVDRKVRPYVEQETEQRLGKEPGEVHYPIEWTSAKQRMAFFATDGFGRGIPYTRTGELVLAWGARTDYRGEVTYLSVYNDAPAAPYVYGDEEGKHQQQFHINTGWPTFFDEIAAIAEAGATWALEQWPSVFDQIVAAGTWDE